MNQSTNHADVTSQNSSDGYLSLVHPDVDTVDEETDAIGRKIEVVEVQQEALAVVLMKGPGGTGQLIVSAILTPQA